MEIIAGIKYQYEYEEGEWEDLTAIEQNGELMFEDCDGELIPVADIDITRLEKAPLELDWGQTPWDNLSREELLREVQRMYSALQSSQSIHSQSKFFAEQYGGNTTYWSKEGLGGAAYEKGRQILEPIEKQFSGESIFRGFYRYADDLLFENNGYKMLGNGWVICDTCGNMTAKDPTRVHELAGKKCSDVGHTKCDGTMELLHWGHLQPIEQNEV